MQRANVRVLGTFAAALLTATLLYGQGMIGRGMKPSRRPPFSGRPWNSKLVDVAAQAGLVSPLVYGGAKKTEYLVETSSGGVAFIDYDRDGWVDLFFVAGTRFETPPQDAGNKLYRNNRDGTFKDVTEAAGLARVAWGSGAAIGDYDNDGFDDLYVTEYGRDTLYRNTGKGEFVDVTEVAGLVETPAPKYPRWGAGATFLDYDLDGDLDLFVSNYVDFDMAKIPKPGEESYCNWKGVPVACGPRGLPPGRNWLHRNNGDGTFTDVTESSGIAAARGSYCMTAVAADLDDDTWPDILVACDSTPSFFFRNNKDGTFSEEGIERGLALADDGREQAGMGLALADFNLDGRLDVFKTHFADDTQGLYLNEGRGQYRDVALAAGLGVETRVVAWGVGMPDLDNDGLPDVFFVVGGVYPDTESVLPDYPYKDRRFLFRNLGGGKFEQIEQGGGAALDMRHSSRGCAFADYDNDGDVDIAVFNRNEPPSLLRNDVTGKNRWIQIKLEGTSTNRGAIGSSVTVHYDGKQQVREVTSQASFYSANDLRLHFGVGISGAVDLAIRWPGGKTQRLSGVPTNQTVTVRESRHLVEDRGAK
jgi:hypothetical protein